MAQTARSVPSSAPHLRVVNVDDPSAPEPISAGFTVIPASAHPLLFGGPASGIPCAVYVSMLTFTNRNGKCWPSLDALAERSGFSRSSVKRALATLVQCGLVTVRIKEGRTHIYSLPHVTGIGGAPARDMYVQPGQSEPPADEYPVHTELGVGHSDLGVVHTELGVGHSDPRTISNNQLQEPESRTTHTSRARARAPESDTTSPSRVRPASVAKRQPVQVAKPKRGQLPDDHPFMIQFAELWQAFPRKVGKGDARRVWLAKIVPRLEADPALFARMVDALDAQRRSEQWQRGVIPNPSTWLNQERWEDELPTPTANHSASSSRPPSRPAGNSESIDLLKSMIADVQARKAQPSGPRPGPPPTASAPASASPPAPEPDDVDDVIDAIFRVSP